MTSELEVIPALFASRGGSLVFPVTIPGKAYRHDPGEKDLSQADEGSHLDFTQVRLKLLQPQIKGKVLAQIVFSAPSGAELRIESMDLLDLVPSASMPGPLQPVDYLLKEFERFGILLYRKTGAFSIHPGPTPSPSESSAVGRAYQVGLFNNCLDAGKWELVLQSRYFDGYKGAHASPKFSHRYRILAHGWFQVDPELYRRLLLMKNPNLAMDPYAAYTALDSAAASAVVKLDALRSLKRKVDTRVLELGHKSKRELFELDEEEMYKYLYGLVLNRSAFHTYADVLQTPVKLAKFSGMGFYTKDEIETFDYGWLKNMERMDMHIIQAPGPDRFVEIRISGETGPYEIVLGNFDLGRLNPGRPVSLAFGFNPLPKLRPQRKTSYSTSYNLGPDGKRVNPYLLILDKRTGRWINNQKLGLEQIFIGWQSVRKDALVLHLVTYERMLPVWMARLAIAPGEFESRRIRNAAMDPGDTSIYARPVFTEARKEREAVRSRQFDRARSSDTVVIDFQALEHPDRNLAAHGHTYDEDGFTLLSGGLMASDVFRTLGTQGYLYPGSTALINGLTDGVNYLAKRDESPEEMIDLEDNLFQLVSMDLSEFAALAPRAVTIVGVRKDSSTVAQSFTLDGRPGHQTVRFGSEFSEVAAVRWISNSTQFDNITLVHRLPNPSAGKVLKETLKLHHFSGQ